MIQRGTWGQRGYGAGIPWGSYFPAEAADDASATRTVQLLGRLDSSVEMTGQLSPTINLEGSRDR